MTDPNKPTPDDSQLGRFAQAWANSHDQVRLYVESVVWNRTDAEDVTQEIAFKAGRGFHTYDPSRPFTAWVMGIARNEIKMYLRKRSRDRHMFDEKLLDLLAQTAEQTRDEISERASALRECLRKLPEQGKALLRMRYVDDTKAPALAERLGLSVNAVHQRLKRIREALANCITKRIAQGGAHG